MRGHRSRLETLGMTANPKKSSNNIGEFRSIVGTEIASATTFPTGRYQPLPRVNFQRGVWEVRVPRLRPRSFVRKTSSTGCRHSPWLSSVDGKSILNWLRRPSRRGPTSSVVFSRRGCDRRMGVREGRKTTTKIRLTSVTCAARSSDSSATTLFRRPALLVTKQNGCSDGSIAGKPQRRRRRRRRA